MARSAVPFIVALLVGACAATPAAAAPLLAGPDASEMAFAATPMDGARLASVHGMGLDRRYFLKRVARDEFEAFGRQTATTLPVTFDNWFNDNGTPLIVANLSR